MVFFNASAIPVRDGMLADRLGKSLSALKQPPLLAVLNILSVLIGVKIIAFISFNVFA
ncbi:hypothetical protein D3C78_1794720 [compost metagenome]